MISKEELDKFTKEELIKAILEIQSGKLQLRAYKAYTKQVEYAVAYMEKNKITDTMIADKEDKKFDRGKIILEKLPDYIFMLNKWEKEMIPLKEEYGIRESNSGSVTSLVKRITSGG